MPHAIKSEQELGSKGLVVVLMESQGSEDIEAFMMKRFPGNPCRVSRRGQLPIRDTSPGIPACALIGVDGTLLAEGLNSKLGGQIDELIAKELAKIRVGWGAHRDLRKVRATLYGKDDLAGAEKMLAQLTLPDDAAEDRAALEAEIATRRAARVKSVAWLRQQGRFADALEVAKSLEKSVKGHPEWEAEAKALVAEFKTPEAAAELKLDAALSKVLAGLEKGIKGGEERILTKLAKGKEDTLVGARIAKLASFVEKAAK